MYLLKHKTSLKMPDSVNRRTDKTMPKRKTKGQTVNYKTQHRKLLIEEQESLFTKNKMKEIRNFTNNLSHIFQYISL